MTGGKHDGQEDNMMDKMMDRGQHGGQDDYMMDTIIDMGPTRSRVCHGDRLPSSANREDTTGYCLLILGNWD